MASSKQIKNSIKTITEDFLDIEEEILIKLEHKLTEAFDESLAVMETEIKKLEKLPPKTMVGDKSVEEILAKAERKFHKEWLKRSLSILRHEYEQSMFRGALQSQAYMKAIPNTGELENGE